jgi:hypothetical protein
MLVVVILFGLIMLLSANKGDRFPVAFMLVSLTVLVTFFEVSRHTSSR